MTDNEFERKVNLRRITNAIFSVSMAINGLGVVETVALACEDPLSEAMSASIAGEVSRLRNVLATLNEARESLEEERMPIEFSEERLLNNEWMDLDTEVTVPMGEPDGPAPNLDERVEASRKSWEAAVYACAKRDVERRFTHYSPKAEQLSTCTTIRNAGMDMALMILGLCPKSEERQKAIDAIDMAVMWANASIARA